MMDKTLQTMLSLARKAQALAYAPYSSFKVGTCIQAGNVFFTGCNLENAAYGATLCSEAAALCAYGQTTRETIARIVIVGSGSEICTPCGVCLQRLCEFASSQTPVHCFNETDESTQKTLGEFFPYPFTSEKLGHS